VIGHAWSRPALNRRAAAARRFTVISIFPSCPVDPPIPIIYRSIACVTAELLDAACHRAPARNAIFSIMVSFHAEIGACDHQDKMAGRAASRRN